MTLPEGWETQYGSPGAIKHSDQPGELSFYFVIVDAIYSDPCEGEGELIEVGPKVDDLAKALVEQPVTVATEPVDTTLGGLPAKRIELTVPEDLDPAACRMGEHLQIWYSPPADKYFVLLGEGTASVYVLDVNGERQVFLAQYLAGATPEDINELQTIIDSITIDTATTTPVPEATDDTQPVLGLPGMSPNEPAGEYGWTGAPGSRGWLHKVIEDPPGVTRQTQLAFTVEDDCFVAAPGAEPTAATVAGLLGLYLEPYDDDSVYWSTSNPSGGETTGAYALPIGDRTLCVYLRWDPATTTDELNAARDVVESIIGEPNGEDGVRTKFALPAGWDTG